MRRPTTRRKLLATFGAASTFSIAGCSGVIPTGPDSDDGSTNTDTDTPDSSGTEDGGTESSSGPGGSSIDDFEGNLEERWETEAGEFTTDTENAFDGDQSLVLQANGEDDSGNVTITRSFFSDSEGENSGIDLSSHDLSLAVRFEQPSNGHIAVECFAPAQGQSLMCRRFIPQELAGWTRFDLGYTGTEGDPDPSSVLQINISVMSDGEPINVGIDDLRKIPKADKGKVMFQFDDSVSSAYDTAFPMFEERGWQGGVAIIPNQIGQQDRLSRGNMQEMASAGWDMMSHTSEEKLPTMSEQEQRDAIKQSKEQLTSIGFETGTKHFVAPNGRVNQTTLNIIQEHHDTNFMFGAGPGNAKQPTNMFTIPRVMGTDPDAVVGLLDLAEKFNQLVVVQYHGIGDEKETTLGEFEQVVNHVDEKDMDVVSPSQFFDSTGN